MQFTKQREKKVHRIWLLHFFSRSKCALSAKCERNRMHSRVSCKTTVPKPFCIRPFHCQFSSTFFSTFRHLCLLCIHVCVSVVFFSSLNSFYINACWESERTLKELDDEKTEKKNKCETNICKIIHIILAIFALFSISILYC